MHHNNDIVSGKISSDIENMEWNMGTTTAQLPNVRYVQIAKNAPENSLIIKSVPLSEALIANVDLVFIFGIFNTRKDSSPLSQSLAQRTLRNQMYKLSWHELELLHHSILNASIGSHSNNMTVFLFIWHSMCGVWRSTISV